MKRIVSVTLAIALAGPPCVLAQNGGSKDPASGPGGAGLARGSGAATSSPGRQPLARAQRSKDSNAGKRKLALSPALVLRTNAIGLDFARHI